MKDLNDTVVVKKRFAVKTAGELLSNLVAYNQQLSKAGLSESTLRGWFSFSGTKNVAAVPIPSKTFVNGVQDGHTAGMYESTGRKPKRVHAESMAEFKKKLEAVRATGVSLNIPAMRALLVSLMKNNGQQALLSPQLLNPRAPIYPSFFCMSHYWMHGLLTSEMGWAYRRGTCAAQKTPHNHQELVDEALSCIAAAALEHNIPRCRLCCADETFMFFNPESGCAPFTMRL